MDYWGYWTYCQVGVCLAVIFFYRILPVFFWVFQLGLVLWEVRWRACHGGGALSQRRRLPCARKYRSRRYRFRLFQQFDSRWTSIALSTSTSASFVARLVFFGGQVGPFTKNTDSTASDSMFSFDYDYFFATLSLRSNLFFCSLVARLFSAFFLCWVVCPWCLPFGSFRFFLFSFRCFFFFSYEMLVESTSHCFPFGGRPCDEWNVPAEVQPPIINETEEEPQWQQAEPRSPSSSVMTS